MNQLSTTNAATKQDFQDLVARLTSALSQHDVVYPALIAAAAPDRELVKLLQKASAADLELLQYIKRKAEDDRPMGIIARIGALLLGPSWIQRH
jgi:hypothetical protein